MRDSAARSSSITARRSSGTDAPFNKKADAALRSFSLLTDGGSGTSKGVELRLEVFCQHWQETAQVGLLAITRIRHDAKKPT